MSVDHKRRSRVLLERECNLIETRFVLVVYASGIEREENRFARLDEFRALRWRRDRLHVDRRGATAARARLIATTLIGSYHRPNSNRTSHAGGAQGDLGPGGG